MSKIDDNTYINKIKKEIMDGRFGTKEDLIDFLVKNKLMILNNPFFRQELADSFIKLNEETLVKMDKLLLDFYDKSKNIDLNSLNLDGVSSFEVNGKDYIKVEDTDGDILVLDDTLEDDNFIEQFRDRQNNLQSASTLNAEENKKAIVKDMQKDKINASLSSQMDVNTRDLTLEEKRQFAAIMKMPNADNINFLVDPTRNIYINKDNGDVYFVNKNQFGVLEVHKANEITSKTVVEEVKTIDDKKEEVTFNIEEPIEPNFDSIDDSDLEYIYQNKFDLLTEEQRQNLKALIEKRKEIQQQNLSNTKENNKVFVKKLDNALHKPYNGFVSMVFLCSIVAIFSLGILMLLLMYINSQIGG